MNTNTIDQINVNLTNTAKSTPVHLPLTKEQAREILTRREFPSYERTDDQAFLTKDVLVIGDWAERAKLYHGWHEPRSVIQQLFDHIEHLEAGCKSRCAWISLKGKGTEEILYYLPRWSTRFWDCDDTDVSFLTPQEKELIKPLWRVLEKHGCKVDEYEKGCTLTPPCNWYEFLKVVLGTEERIVAEGLAEFYEFISWSVECETCEEPIMDLVWFESEAYTAFYLNRPSLPAASTSDLNIAHPLKNCICGARTGELHKDGCEYEHCWNCGEVGCDCSYGGPQRARWLGESPGKAACRMLGFWCVRDEVGYRECGPDHPGAIPDLNRLQLEGEWDREAQRWSVRGNAPCNTIKIQAS